MLCCAVLPQVVRTTVEPLGGPHRPGVQYDAYEYLANHHSYKRDEHPTVKITYNLSPLQVGALQGLHGAASVVYGALAGGASPMFGWWILRRPTAGLMEHYHAAANSPQLWFAKEANGTSHVSKPY